MIREGLATINRERLKEVKKAWELTKEHKNISGSNDTFASDIDWLVEQAELLEESDKEMLDRELSHMALYNDNKRLREVLKNIIKVDGDYYSDDVYDMKDIAKSALEETK